NYSLNTAQEDTNRLNIQRYKGYSIIDRENRFRPFLLESTMQFQPGEYYNRSEHNQTLNRLISLNTFKFVKNRFETIPDTALLDVFYYLTPMPSKSLRAEIVTINRSNNLNGSQINLTWRHRNFFRGAEQVTFTAYVGSDVQFSGSFSGYNTFRTGAELGFGIPHILIPFRTLKVKGGFTPRTTIRGGYDILKRQELFTLNSYRLEYGYTYKRSLQKTTEVNPVSINYVQAVNVTDKFRQLIHQDTILAKTIQSQFILGSNFQYNYNEVLNGLQKLNNYYFNGIVDVSGNIAGLFTGANFKKGKEQELFGAPFAQYIKTEFDGRYYRKLGLGSSWANRLIVGIGIPYGNSVELPYIKQFFVGGNNSLRGFRSRGVGPGTYFPVNLAVLPDQTGDIKLEMNTEYRPKISGPFYGAVFVDAGNIWLFNDSMYTKRPGGKFTGEFLKQLAVDAGVGLRLDITIFVIRFDIGFPLRIPWEQDPWVVDRIQLNDPGWRRSNIVYNLAIGYPF
ncbi:MAG TPA: BamA/TamA family outer membrane protein, partial [Flavisolibacter sp.]